MFIISSRATTAARYLLRVVPGISRPVRAEYALRLSRPPDQFPSLVVVTDASSTGFGFVLFDLRRTVNAKVNGLTRRCVDVTLFKGTWRVLSTRWRTFSVAYRRMAAVRHGPMGRCPDYSIQVTPAFRVYADAAERTGLTLPFGKTAAATISTAFLYIGAARPQRFATATVASYYHNVIRLARLMLMEPDAATSRLVGSLATKRIQRPESSSAGPFSSPQYNPTAVGAAAAIERLMAVRRSPSEPLWRKQDGTHVVPSDLVAALQAANPHLRMCRITPHSFRISAASWLVNQAHVSRERVAALGRWHDPKSLDTYIRVNTVVPEFTRLDRSAMP
ncbi:hypothetical protein FNF28_07668 [Cafeteria roenbergensis]|uniref:Uncharacterized protein n=1 Tax=Cafeteria roenbergensis TaxID=33653 RepID=A0A5A8C1I5_CAFRO|nr:hypothetical protein FNF28_07668 [Cafeteria roenbergensis]